MRYDSHRKRLSSLGARIRDNDAIVERCMALVRRFQLNEVEIAAMLGTSPMVPIKLLSGHTDFYMKTMDAMRDFVDRSKGAIVRSDLRLPDKANQ